MTQDELAQIMGKAGLPRSVPAPLLEAGDPVDQTNEQIAADFAQGGPGAPPANAPPSPVTAWSNPQSDLNRASIAANPNATPTQRNAAQYGGTVPTNPALGPQVRPPMAPPPEAGSSPVVFANKGAAPTTSGGAGGGFNPYAAYTKARQGELGALGELGEAQQHQAEDQGVAALNKSAELDRQRVEGLQKAQEHDAEIQRQMTNLDAMSKEAASKKINPDRWYRNQSTGSSLMWTLASALGGFAQGYTHGAVGNSALEAMKEHVNNDIAAAKEEIESKKGRVGDMRGILAETYRRFGNMDQAVLAAQVLSLQKLGADAEVMSAQSNSSLAKANNDVLQASLKSDIALKTAQFQARAAGAGVMTPQQRANLDKTLLENEKLRQGLQGGAGVPQGPAPKSTSFLSHPWDYVTNKLGIQGTEGYRAGLQQQAANIPVHTYAHKVGGIRTPEGQREVYGSLMVQPNDSPDTIRFKRALQDEMLRQGGGGAANDTDESPEGFSKIGDTDD